MPSSLSPPRKRHALARLENVPRNSVGDKREQGPVNSSRAATMLRVARVVTVVLLSGSVGEVYAWGLLQQGAASSQKKARYSHQFSWSLHAHQGFQSPSLLILPEGSVLHPSASVVQISERERGVVIEADIPPLTPLISVPLERAIPPQAGKETVAGRAIHVANNHQQEKLKVDDYSYLALWICENVARLQRKNRATSSDGLYEKEPEDAAAVQAYLESLPQLEDIVPSLPVFWHDDELETLLQGSIVVEETRRKRQYWHTLYEDIGRICPTFGSDTNLETFMWAQCLVHNRSYRLRYHNESEDAPSSPEDEDSGSIALVPLADMLNHQTQYDPTTCDWSVDEHSGCLVIATRDAGLSPKSEACISYGHHSYAHFLSVYGFCPEHEETPTYGSSPNKAHIYFKNDVFELQIGNNVGVNRLFAKLRAWVDSTASATEQVSGETCVSYEAPRSVQNEQRSVELLQQCVEDALACYATSLEEDLASLTSTDTLVLGSKTRNAVRVRVSEKQVLEHWKGLCQASCMLLGDASSNKASWDTYCMLLQTTPNHSPPTK